MDIFDSKSFIAKLHIRSSVKNKRNKIEIQRKN